MAFDGLAQARSGAMACNGDGQPFLNHLPYVDFSTALYGGFGIMAALYERERTGKGQFVEVSLMETISAFAGTYGMVAETELTDTTRRRQGNALVYALGDCVQAGDGGFVVFNCIGNMFRRLCEMIDHAEFLDEPRFCDRRPAVCQSRGTHAARHAVGEPPDDVRDSCRCRALPPAL